MVSAFFLFADESLSEGEESIEETFTEYVSIMLFNSLEENIDADPLSRGGLQRTNIPGLMGEDVVGKIQQVAVFYGMFWQQREDNFAFW